MCVCVVWTVLSVSPGDEDANRCKIVALIKADKIDEALSIVNKVPLDFSFLKVKKCVICTSGSVCVCVCVCASVFVMYTC